MIVLLIVLALILVGAILAYIKFHSSSAEGINLALIKQRVSEGLISARPHKDDCDLIIYNYTPEAQFSRSWDEATLACRGLIMRGKKVVARPFSKFFNFGEVPFTEFEGLSFKAFEKFDGSLGIGYRAPDGIPAIATRGSFHSEQADWATAFLRENQVLAVNSFLNEGLTPLFEIIYPANRIVVNYGDRKDLVLIAVIENDTGVDRDHVLEAKIHGWTGPVATPVETLDGETLTIQGLRDLELPNAEGFVLLFENGTRLKVKFEEYLRLHKLLTGLTEVKVWEMLQSTMGQSFAAYRDYVPDEFYDWMVKVKDEIEKRYSEIERSCLSTLSQVNRGADRKTQADFIKNMPYSGIVFKMLDDKPYQEQIWKLVRPVADKPFVQEPE